MDRPEADTIIRVLGELLGRPATRDDVEPFLWSGTELPPVTVDQYLETHGWLLRWRRRIVQWWSTGFDLLLTPTVREPPVTLESMRPAENHFPELRDNLARHVFFAWPFNITGQPAISLPLHWTREGLPVGVQPVAAMGHEYLLIRIASQI
jgi:amidase